MADETIVGPADEYDETAPSSSLRTVGGSRPSWCSNAASDPTSTFHAHFVWDDTEAAHRYRLQQAGGLIRKFKIVRNVGGRTIKVDAFVKVPDSTDGYVPVQEAVTMDWVVQQRRIRIVASMERLAVELRHWDEFTAVADAITDDSRRGDDLNMAGEARRALSRSAEACLAAVWQE